MLIKERKKEHVAEAEPFFPFHQMLKQHLLQKKIGKNKKSKVLVGVFPVNGHVCANSLHGLLLPVRKKQKKKEDS